MPEFRKKAFLLLASTFSSALAHLRREEPKLDKPAVDDSSYWEIVENSLANLPTVPHTIEVWENDSIPIDCKSIWDWTDVNKEYLNLTTDEVEVFSVTYEDCDSGPWTFCRHSTAFYSKEVMAEHLGKVPPVLRTYIHYSSAWGGDVEEDNIAYYILGTGDISFQADTLNSSSIWLHEVAHAYDDQYLDGLEDSWFTQSSVWTNAYNKDEAVVSEYARNNQQENFAEAILAMIYELNFEGGLQSLTDTVPQWAHMHNLLYRWFGSDLVLNGTCGDRPRHPPSELIDKYDLSATGQPAKPFKGERIKGESFKAEAEANATPTQTSSGADKPPASPTPSPSSTSAASNKPHEAQAPVARLNLLDILVPSFMFEVVSGAIKSARWTDKVRDKWTETVHTVKNGGDEGDFSYGG